MNTTAMALQRRAEIAMLDGDYHKVAVCYRLARQFVKLDPRFEAYDEVQCEEMDPSDYGYREEVA